jgi:hypothetical protein
MSGATKTYSTWKTFFDETNREYLELTYENIYDNFKGLRTLVDYLDVPNNIEFASLYRKIDTKQIYNNITNKNEIRHLESINE